MREGRVGEGRLVLQNLMSIPEGTIDRGDKVICDVLSTWACAHIIMHVHARTSSGMWMCATMATPHTVPAVEQ